MKNEYEYPVLRELKVRLVSLYREVPTVREGAVPSNLLLFSQEIKRELLRAYTGFLTDHGTPLPVTQQEHEVIRLETDLILGEAGMVARILAVITAPVYTTQIDPHAVRVLLDTGAVSGEIFHVTHHDLLNDWGAEDPDFRPIWFHSDEKLTPPSSHIDPPFYLIMRRQHAVVLKKGAGELEGLEHVREALLRR